MTAFVEDDKKGNHSVEDMCLVSPRLVESEAGDIRRPYVNDPGALAPISHNT